VKETKNMTARALTHGQKVFLFSADCYEDRKKNDEKPTSLTVIRRYITRKEKKRKIVAYSRKKRKRNPSIRKNKFILVIFWIYYKY